MMWISGSAVSAPIAGLWYHLEPYPNARISRYIYFAAFHTVSTVISLVYLLTPLVTIFA